MSSSSKAFRFPVTEDDYAHDIAPGTTIYNPHIYPYLGVTDSKKAPLPFIPISDPSTRDGSPADFCHLELDLLAPPTATSRRGSQHGYDLDSRRGSAKNMAMDVMKDMRKGVKMVTDSTVEAGNMVKGRTADAGKWVAIHSSKRAKAAMEQARSSLSCTEKFTLYVSDKISILSKHGFTHLLMFLMMVVYTALGAGIFLAVEGSHEEREKTRIATGRTKLIHSLWNDTKDMQDLENYKITAQKLFDLYEDELDIAYRVGIGPYTDVRVWTFWRAMFFCSAITTTIGYGDVTPKTGLGQCLTIFYALIGIPLFLILLADFGKLFTRMLKQLFILLAKMKKCGPYRRIKESDFVQSISERIRPVTDKLGFSKEEESTDPEDYFSDGNFNLPVSLALGILSLYILIGSFLFSIWEEWNTFQSFYFIFISMTTIGFGDYVPNHPGFMMAATVYLVFGLALTAMSINIIQEKLTDTFSKATVNLKESLKSVISSTSHSEDEDEDDVEDTVKNGTNTVVNVESSK